MNHIVPELLDKNEVASLLGISSRLVEYKTSSGELPGFRKLFGRTARWSRSEIMEWIQDGCPTIRTDPHQSANLDSHVVEELDSDSVRGVNQLASTGVENVRSNLSAHEAKKTGKGGSGGGSDST